MKKLILFVLLLLVAIVFWMGKGGQEAQAKIINPNKDSHVIFYIPHQDDEALTFGVGILNHYWSGHNVHIVLMTDGAASGVKRKLGLTSAEFTAARNKEFYMSTAIMGIKPERIEYKNYPDGALSVANAESVMKEYELKYPNAKHKTFSWTDPHVDHKNSGIALRNLVKSGIISDARYYVGQRDNPTGITLMKESFKEEYRPFLSAASAAYSIKNERLGLYGIGNLSVGPLFRDFKAQPLSRYHK